MDKRTKSTKHINDVLTNLRPKLILKIVFIVAGIGAVVALYSLYDKYHRKTFETYINNNKEWIDSQYGK